MYNYSFFYFAKQRFLFNGLQNFAIVVKNEEFCIEIYTVVK